MIVIVFASGNEYAGKSGADQLIRMDWAGPFGLAQASYVDDRNCEEVVRPTEIVRPLTRLDEKQTILIVDMCRGWSIGW